MTVDKGKHGEAPESLREKQKIQFEHAEQLIADVRITIQKTQRLMDELKRLIKELRERLNKTP